MKNALLLGILLLTQSWAYGQQTDCSSIGFEDGTTRGWVLTHGVVTDDRVQTVYQDEFVGTAENGHYVTSASDGYDPKITTDRISMVAPGSKHSIRIGNTVHGATFDRIKTSYAVTADNTLFQYQFAVVLENPTHLPFQQPAFTIQITNTAGKTISCAYYNVTAAGTIPGFKALGDIRYRDWTTGAIDLRDYVGQTINIVVTAHGCTEHKHFGYAYFDAQCTKAQIKPDLYCPDTDKYMTLRAPDGFAAYTWSNGATTPTIQITPTLGARYWVQVQPFSSLEQSCKLQLDYVVDFEKARAPTEQMAAICEGERYVVGDSTYRRAGTYLTRVGRGVGRCDSLVHTVLSVRPLGRSTQRLSVCDGASLTVGDTAFRTAGTHVQRFSRPAPLCDSLVTTFVSLNRFDLTVRPDTLASPATSVRLWANTSPGDSYAFTWSPSGDLTCATCATTLAKPGQTTRYELSVTNLATGCQKTASVLISVGSCVFAVPDAFSPNNDGINDVFFVPANDCIRRITEFVVYDRWGEVIFRQENVPVADPAYGWNGTYHGALAAPGVYAYKLRLDFVDGPARPYRGTILLLK